MAMKKPAQAASVGWTLGDQIGQGGQGDVFVATRKDEPNGPNHAFKFLKTKAAPRHATASGTSYGLLHPHPIIPVSSNRPARPTGGQLFVLRDGICFRL